MQSCGRCGHESRPAHRFCTRCGARLPREVPPRFRLLLLSEGCSRGWDLLDGPTTLGRDPGSAIVIAEDHVSGRHALLEVEGEEVWVTDIGSRNGVMVNGRPVQGRTPFPPGALLKVGRSFCKLVRAD